MLELATPNPVEAAVQDRLVYVHSRIADIFAESPELTESLRQYVTEWATHLSAVGKSDNTILTYLTHVVPLFRYMAKYGVPVNMTSSQASKFVSVLPRALSATARNMALYAVRSFYKWLTREYPNAVMQYVDGRPVGSLNPFEQVEGVKSRTRLPRPLTREQYSSIYGIMYRMRTDTKIMELRMKRFTENWEILPFLLLMNSGLRTMELLSLRARDFALDERGNLTIRVKGKGGVERTAYVVDVYGQFHEQLALAIDAKTTDIAQYFWSEMKLSREKGRNEKVFEGMTRNKLYQLLKALNEFPVRVEGAESPTEFTLHQFRHTYATYLWEKGVPLETIKELLGHVSLNTTLIYTKQSEERKSQSIAAVMSGDSQT